MEKEASGVINNKNKKGFTLLELIIVFLIVSALVTIGIIQYDMILERMRTAEATRILNVMRKLNEEYFLKEGVYADTQEELGIEALGIPKDNCVSTHYYRYYSNPSQGYAARCIADGKEPQGSGGGPYFDVRLNYNTGELQISKVSCPLIFSFDGKNYLFVSDFLGSSVLGYYMGKLGNRKIYVPVDGDEYIKIDSSQLKEEDGVYRLKVNEMLQEVTYLDKVELVAVDHPVDYDIYPDEALIGSSRRFFAIMTSRNEQLPISAVDDKGREVLKYITTIDRMYAPFDNIEISGFARLHHLILDLGNIDVQNSILYINGWTEYANSKESAKVNDVREAEKQGIHMKLPSLEVIGKNGEWEEVTSFMGMPAGLTKTMTFRLQDRKGKSIFPTEDHRIRISTNQRIYYDKIWTSSFDADSYKVFRLMPQKADLHFYGWSAFSSDDGREPGFYNYSQKVKKDYVKLEGYATRYGDALPLLEETDDKFVIMTSGDEIDLEFSSKNLPKLPEGWKRDFLFYINGYFKAASPGRAYAYTIKPLPFRKMFTFLDCKHYPYNDIFNPIEIIRYTNFLTKHCGSYVTLEDLLVVIRQYFDYYLGKKTCCHYPQDEDHQNYQREYNTRYIPAYFPN
ncbi:MAG: type II secretion system protein [Candidatus Omnitrophota bacterium]